MNLIKFQELLFSKLLTIFNYSNNDKVCCLNAIFFKYCEDWDAFSIEVRIAEDDIMHHSQFVVPIEIENMHVIGVLEDLVSNTFKSIVDGMYAVLPNCRFKQVIEDLNL
jgi:hypothetical protein